MDFGFILEICCQVWVFVFLGCVCRIILGYWKWILGLFAGMLCQVAFLTCGFAFLECRITIEYWKWIMMPRRRSFDPILSVLLWLVVILSMLKSIFVYPVYDFSSFVSVALSFCLIHVVCRYHFLCYNFHFGNRNGIRISKKIRIVLPQSFRK